MNRRRWTAAATTACAVAALITMEGATSTSASPPVAPSAKDPARTGLANGLGRLVAQSEGASEQSLTGAEKSPFRPEALAIKDAQGRVMIDLTPQETADRAAYRAEAEKLGLVVEATDEATGTLEGYAPLSAMRSLSALGGTGTISLAAAPAKNTGSVADQGVPFQNVDQVFKRGVDGKGITVGALSDSYDTATTYVTGEPLDIHAAQDIASGDLPGPGNPKNSSPVKVLEELPAGQGGADEGRAMLQIVHDVAPQADLCFATAFSGEVGFANNIRDLADKAGRCRADVVVDDVFYYGEPVFSDGIIATAVQEVTDEGTSYFSSAGNQGEHQSWRAPVDLVPASSALAGTNLDFSQVDPALYDGGLQDFKPGPGVDPAQTYALTAAGGIFNLQWDDPLDLDGATLGAPYFRGTGEITAADPEQSFTFTATAGQVGQQVQFRTDGIPSGTTDLILTITDPDGNEVASVDTGSSPEVYVTTLQQAGDYTITISGFQGATGDFTVDVRPITAPSKVTTDFNALFFTEDGDYLGAQADINTLSGRPQELAQLAGFSHLQVVISRAGTGPMGATTLSQINGQGMYVDEYYDPRAPSTSGHSVAQGAVGVAAFDPFKPYLPERFTSAGGLLPVKWDVNGNPYPTTQLRRSPWIASVDGANTTFFVSDTALDADTTRNFFGTSAAAPHAAAIAALVIDQRGGPGSIDPGQVKTVLRDSTFANDLDPFSSSATSNGLSIKARGDEGRETSPYRGFNADPNFFRLSYTGRVPLQSVTFYGDTAGPSGGNGILFDPRAYTGGATVRNQGFPFTVGAALGGLSSSAVSASFSGKPQAPAVTGQFRTMTVSFTGGLAKGQGVRFGVDRDYGNLTGFAAEGNSANSLGGATLMPSGTVVRNGMQFHAVRTDGSSFDGVIRNKIGEGFSVQTGYGVVDALEAVVGIKSSIAAQ